MFIKNRNLSHLQNPKFTLYNNNKKEKKFNLNRKLDSNKKKKNLPKFLKVPSTFAEISSLSDGQASQK